MDDNVTKSRYGHLCCSWIHKRLKSFLRLVVLFDAAHSRDVHKETLYVVLSVLAGANKVFPIGFMISTVDEDGPTWIIIMLGYLRKAWPILLE